MPAFIKHCTACDFKDARIEDLEAQVTHLSDAINAEWMQAYGGIEVTDIVALCNRVKSFATDRECWLKNAQITEKARQEAEAQIKTLKSSQHGVVIGAPCAIRGECLSFELKEQLTASQEDTANWERKFFSMCGVEENLRSQLAARDEALKVAREALETVDNGNFNQAGALRKVREALTKIEEVLK